MISSNPMLTNGSCPKQIIPKVMKRFRPDENDPTYQDGIINSSKIFAIFSPCLGDFYLLTKEEPNGTIRSIG